MNYELMTANCLCDSSLLQSFDGNNNTKHESIKEEKINFNILTKSIIANLFDFNVDIINCYNLVFNLKILVHNLGFYCMALMFILQLIFLFIYHTKKLKSIKYFMLIFNNEKIKERNNLYPPKYKKYINDKKLFKSKNIETTNTPEFNDEKYESNSNSKKKIRLINTNVLEIITKKNKLKSNTLFFSIADKKKKKEMQTEAIDSCASLKANNIIKNQNRKIIHKILTNKKIGKISFFNKNKIEEKKNNSIHQNIIRISNNGEHLQDMDYKMASFEDKRSFLRIYLSYLVDSQIILGTFCTENYLNLFIIKLSFFVYTFQISFFLNAFFYTDKYISDAYHNDGVLDFFSGLPKSIYSFFATLITTNLLKMLSSSKSELMRVLKGKRKYKNYLYIIDIKLRKLKRKLVIYFIFVFLLGLFFLYYVSAFCAVYRNSQRYWVIGCLESFGVDCLVSVIICILPATFRYIAIKKHIKFCYILANIISIFL